MGNAQGGAGGQQFLGEAQDAEADQNGQSDAVQPGGHRAIGPEVLETMAAHAGDKYQRGRHGQHVPEVSSIAQSQQDKQVVQQ